MPVGAGDGAAVIFRAPTALDFPLLAEIRRDPFMHAMLMAIPERTDDAAVQQWIERRVSEPGGLFQAIVEADTDRAVGFIQICEVNRNDRRASGALAVSKHSRLPGIGQFAMRELLRAACCDLGLRKLTAEIRADNQAAIKMNLLCGYRIVGTLEQHFADADDARHDVVLLERLLDPAAFRRKN